MTSLFYLLVFHANEVVDGFFRAFGIENVFNVSSVLIQSTITNLCSMQSTVCEILNQLTYDDDSGLNNYDYMIANAG